MTWILTSVLFLPYSKLYILTELSSNDVKFIPVDRHKLDLSKYIYNYGTVNSIFVEIQPNSTNIKNDPHITLNKMKHSRSYLANNHFQLFTCLVICHAFVFICKLFFKINSPTMLSGKLSECQMFWIQIRTGILSVLIWHQTVCKGHQQTTKVCL